MEIQRKHLHNNSLCAGWLWVQIGRSCPLCPRSALLLWTSAGVGFHSSKEQVEPGFPALALLRLQHEPS